MRFTEEELRAISNKVEALEKAAREILTVPRRIPATHRRQWQDLRAALDALGGTER